MKLGMFMMPLHPVDRDMTRALTLKEDLATIIHADRIGFDEMWVGEHASCLFAAIMKPDSAMPDELLTAESAVADRVIWGSPRRVAEQLLALRAEIGPFGGLVTSQHDWDGKDFETRSMQLLAEEAMPIVRRAA